MHDESAVGLFGRNELKVKDKPRQWLCL